MTYYEAHLLCLSLSFLPDCLIHYRLEKRTEKKKRMEVLTETDSTKLNVKKMESNNTAQAPQTDLKAAVQELLRAYEACKMKTPVLLIGYMERLKELVHG